MQQRQIGKRQTHLVKLQRFDAAVFDRKHSRRSVLRSRQFIEFQLSDNTSGVTQFALSCRRAEPCVGKAYAREFLCGSDRTREFDATPKRRRHEQLHLLSRHEPKCRIRTYDDWPVGERRREPYRRGGVAKRESHQREILGWRDVGLRRFHLDGRILFFLISGMTEQPLPLVAPRPKPQCTDLPLAGLTNVKPVFIPDLASASIRTGIQWRHDWVECEEIVGSLSKPHPRDCRNVAVRVLEQFLARTGSICPWRSETVLGDFSVVSRRRQHSPTTTACSPHEMGRAPVGRESA
jgi:hypothetical protein